jgi:hypothetical protein
LTFPDNDLPVLRRNDLRFINIEIVDFIKYRPLKNNDPPLGLLVENAVLKYVALRTLPKLCTLVKPKVLRRAIGEVESIDVRAF